MPILPKCPPGYAYCEDARRYIPYHAENINRGGVLITAADGWRQKSHPLDAMRRTAAGSDAGTVTAVREAGVKHRDPMPAGRAQCVSCPNMATVHHKDCSTCRARKRRGRERYFRTAVVWRAAQGR